MLPYCFKCKKNTKKVDSKVLKTKNGRTTLSSKCAACSCKKSRSMKGKEAKGILSGFGLKIPLSKVPLFGDILF